jgi:hypothetical protein
MELAVTIWKLCLSRHLQLTAQHIRETDNQLADALSRRTFTKNQWRIRPDIFHQLIQPQLGPHDIDLFAESTTHLLPKYGSWLPDPKAFLTDALVHNWKGLSNPFDLSKL